MDQEGGYSNPDLAMVKFLEACAHLPSSITKVLLDPAGAGTKIPIRVETPAKPRQFQNRLNEQRRVELVDRYKAGLTVKQVAKEFNVDPSAASRIIARAGVPKRGRHG